jgi:Holliday junction resolvase-like predicted endonuclease
VSVERNLIISLLKLTKKGPILIENVKEDSRTPLAMTKKLLANLQNEELVYLKSDSVEASTSMRLKLMIKATSLGADVEQISNFLCWQEFEEIAAFALKNYGYTVTNNVRFKHASHRWEIDVVACKKPLVVCIDCKHWQHAITPSALRKIVDAQLQRTKALAESLPNLSVTFECTKWANAKFTPVILSLMPSAYKFVDDVPIVPILKLQDFINQMPVYMDSLKFFPRSFNSLSHNF